MELLVPLLYRAMRTATCSRSYYFRNMLCLLLLLVERVMLIPQSSIAPTLGAGFWAEEWQEPLPRLSKHPQPQGPLAAVVAERIWQAVGECLPGLGEIPPMAYEDLKSASTGTRAIAMSGTGNGDSFLRTAGVRTAAAIARFAPQRSLASAVTQIAGPGGELQQSAGDRWHKTGEGEGGIIGIELINGVGRIVYDFNCGGMFRTWIDADGTKRVMVFKDEYYR